MLKLTDISRKQIFLFFGAGVLGSYYAAKLQKGGHEATVVARGQRNKVVQKPS